MAYDIYIYIYLDPLVKNLILLYENKKGPDQPAHQHNLVSTFLIPFLERILSKLASCTCKIYILNKSENATLQLSIFCEKVFDKMYLLKLNNGSQTSSKRFVETPPICLV